MNRRGFTLIEVIMVVVLMSIILLLLVPNVFVLVEKNNEKACNSIKNNIESAAKMYVTNNKYDLGFSCGTTKNITFQTLIDSGDLKLDSTGKIVNPINESEVSLANIVKVTYNYNIKEFTYEVTGIDCANN